MLVAALATPRLAVVGLSRGSEAAILTAVHGGLQVAGAVLTVPANVCFGGWPNDGRAWVIGGVPVRWADQTTPTGEIPNHPDRGDPKVLRPVERVEGPLLLVAAGADEVWPSAAMAASIMSLRRQNRRNHADRLLEYPRARHALGYLIPQPSPGLLPPGVSDDEATQRARADAWPRVVSFLRALAAG